MSDRMEVVAELRHLRYNTAIYRIKQCHAVAADYLRRYGIVLVDDVKIGYCNVVNKDMKRAELEDSLESILKDAGREHSRIKSPLKTEDPQPVEKPLFCCIPKYKQDDEQTIYDVVRQECIRNDIPNELQMMVFMIVIEYIRNDKCKPIILTGNSGIGKTYIAQVIANVLGLRFYKISSPGATTGYGLIGDCKNYKAGRHGEIAQAQIITGTTNPVILIDEIDKADIKGASGVHRIEDELLSCLDGTRMIHDNFLEKDVDTSKMIFILTANEDIRLSPWLKDRCTIVEFPDPDVARITSIAHKILTRISNNSLYTGRLTCDEGALEKTISTMRAKGIVSLRQYEALLEDAATSCLHAFLAKEIDKLHIDARILEAVYERIISSMGIRTFGFAT
ncbi:MAG: AAA family ATPase [Clostridiales bacterium]|nr:AAA family ATPase [Clostridiales bacterium]